MSFLGGAFLFGLALLVVPWWLHRRRAEQHRERVISSLLLVRPSEAPVAARRAVQRRGLLALRLLLVALLVLAFAQPMLERRGGGAAAQAVPQVIALDTSLSMQPHFGAARRAAQRLIRRLPDGVPAAVVAVADRVTVAAPMTADHTALRAAVASLEAGAGRLRFDGLIGRLTALAGTWTVAPAAIVLVSDFQQSAMPVHFNGLLAGATGAVSLIPVGDSPDNWAVTGVSPAGDASEVVVTVRSHGRSERRLDVVLEGPQGRLAGSTLAVPAGGEARWRVPAPVSPEHHLWLRAAIDADDALPTDDAAFLVRHRPQPVAVPLLATGTAAGQVRYLEAAVAAAAPRFRLAPPEASGPVAVLADPASLSGPERRRLDRHFELGGSALMTAGPAMARAGRLPLLDLPLRPVDPGEARAAVVRDAGHPALPPTPAWREVRVSRHLAPVEPLGGRVLVALEDGSPLLVEHRYGAGRLLVLLTALEPGWTNLTATPGFVAFAAAALGHLARDELPTAAVAGRPLTLPRSTVQLFDGAGRRMLGLDEQVDAAVVLPAPGVYTLRTPGRERLLAANVDPLESDLRRADPALLARWERASRVLERGSVADAAASEAQAWPLAPWLLILLLWLGLVEPLIANRVARRRPELVT